MKKLLSLLLLSWLAIGAGRGQAISPYLAGQNAWMPTALGTQVFNGQLDRLWPLVKQSKVKMIRIGGNGPNVNLVTNAQYIALIDSIRRIGAEPMVQVSEGRGRLTAAQAAQVVQHVNITMRRNVKYWIIGNEPDLTAQPNPTPIPGVEAYIKAFASAMKAVDPSILTVGPENAGYNAYYPALVGGANDITGKDANGRYYIDIISFHTYAFGGNQTRPDVVNAIQGVTSKVTNLVGLLAAANAKHNRTGASALRWALTEFNVNFDNPAVNTVEGVGAHSFINGQFWAEVFGVGMKYEALSMQPWSIHESNGGRGLSDLGYIDGSGANFKPRSSYWHEMLVAENLHGTNLNATDNQALVKVVSSTDQGTTAVMVLNESDATAYDFTVQLSTAAVPGAAPLKINVPAGINAAYNDKIPAQCTLVLLFDAQGALTRKIVYSLQHAQNALPPSYLRPGQSVSLAGFTANKTFSCVAPETVTYTGSVLGEATSLTWNFGAGATPATASGPGPFAVTYATAGTKDVTLTLVNPDTTIVVSKPAVVRVSSCARTPFNGTPAQIPGVVRAVEYDFGGQDVAFNDSDPTNRGLQFDANVPRPNEAVDTQNGDGGYGNIGFSANGEWLKYTVNIQNSGFYKVTFRVSTGATSAASLRLSVNDVDKTGVVAIPATGSFNTYQNIVLNNVYLEASPNVTLKFDLVTTSFNISRITFETQPMTGIVVNRVYNAGPASDGAADAVELLVVQDHLDARGLIVKDFDADLTTDNGGKYQFKDQALWKDLRLGTTIVLRKLAAGIPGYVEDLSASDSRLDLALENTTYLTSLSGPGQVFNLTDTDMVLLKTGSASGVANPVHAFVTGTGNATALFAATTGPKLVSTAANAAGSFQYPLSTAQTTADFDGAKAAASSSTSFNWGNGFGANNVAYINGLRLSILPPTPDIVVNRVYNGSNDGVGTRDAVELLVIKDHLDIRGLLVKDFDANITTDNGGKYRFTNIPFWQDLRAGTTIVLHKVATGVANYVQDTDASDFTVDLLLENATYLANETTGTNAFIIAQYDMVLLKTGAATGLSGAIHAFATRGGGNGAPTALFQSITSPKLVSPNKEAGGAPGAYHYPLNLNQRGADFSGSDTEIMLGGAPNWGYGMGSGNIAYIQSLRDAVLPPATALAATVTGNSIALSWTDNSATETNFEVFRSLDGTAYTLLATVAANATTYTDACLGYATQYYYQVRAKEGPLTSRFTAPAPGLTAERPVVTLPTLTAECSVTATTPTAPDYCGGTVTATTTDPTTYAAQGSYTISWHFVYGDGGVVTVPQPVLVSDQTAPVVLTRNISVTLVSGSAAVTPASIDNGSTDACGVQTLTLDKTSFDCSNLGANLVTLTVTDANGNTATGTATVTVISTTPAPAIAVSRTDNTYTGLPASTIALGYGAQSLVLTASNGTSAAAATTYTWSPAAGLSSSTAAAPVFTPTAAGTFTFTVLATNEFGCVASATVTLTVVDVRCGNKNDKVLVCHNGNELCISTNAVATHLAEHGDQLGACGTVAARGAAAPALGSGQSARQATVLEAFPNPFATRAEIRFRPAATAATQVQVYSAMGQLVRTLYDAVAETGRDYTVTFDGRDLPAGIYTCRLVSNGTVETRRLVLLK
ncbi:carbohydrate-binding protein [Hymenobacter puniceus]|uniref:carbohydrate-binding protein n=1 Tax=Hymenobacter sp. BT190 TaxID=2763505 RepID=UPI001650DCED|nr:carbohydrate-binding protein [Hymenobacter sp. BT190]MBC6700141.1 carbohydrate-binding protein [Hymenobacter sp. BT190]